MDKSTRSWYVDSSSRFSLKNSLIEIPKALHIWDSVVIHGRLFLVNIFASVDCVISDSYASLYTKTRTGATLALGDFTFDASEANTKYDVPMKEVIIVVKNKSLGQDLGMYFWNTENNYADSVYIHATTNSETGFVAGTVPNQAEIIKPESTEYSDILYGHHLYDSNDETPIADVFDVEYEFYKHIPKAVDANSNGVVDAGEEGVEMIRMFIRLDKLVEDEVEVDLNIKLNIEKYVSNFASTDVTNAKTYSTNKFIKLSTGITGSCPTFGGGYMDTKNTYISHVVLPKGIRSLVFYGCTALKSIGIPSTVSTSIGDATFYGCAGLTSIIIPSNIRCIK